MTDEEIDKMADDFVNAQEFTKVYGIARKAECGAFWKYGFLAGLKAQVEIMKVCSNCKHFNNLDDLEYCQNCERQLVNSLDKLPREEIIKDEWELKE